MTKKRPWLRVWVFTSSAFWVAYMLRSAIDGSMTLAGAIGYLLIYSTGVGGFVLLMRYNHNYFGPFYRAIKKLHYDELFRKS